MLLLGDKKLVEMLRVSSVGQHTKHTFQEKGFNQALSVVHHGVQKLYNQLL